MEKVSVRDRLIKHGAKKTLVGIINNHTYAWFGDEVVYEYDEEGHMVKKYPVPFGFDSLEVRAMQTMGDLISQEMEGAIIYDSDYSKEEKLAMLKKFCNSGAVLKVYHDLYHYPTVYKNYKCSNIPAKMNFVIVKYANGRAKLVVVYEN